VKDPAARRRASRLEFLDILRGVFILSMVEGHTLRALLDPAIRASAVFQYHELIHNLSGPVFLFASGVAFVYSTCRDWQSYRRWSGKLGRRMVRWTGVLAVGYALQLPYNSLRTTLAQGTAEQFASLAGLNILQCICLSLILLQMLAMAVPRERWFPAVLAAGAVAIGILTPLAWQAGQDWPVWVGSLVSGRTRSIFPLFPYAGFSLAGAAWGYAHLRSREAGEERGFLKRSIGLCSWVSVGALALVLAPLPKLYSDFWYSSPLFFFIRAGMLGVIAASFRFWDMSASGEGARPWTRRWLTLMGQESLLIYVAHLVALYGSVFNADTSMVKWLGTHLSLASGVGAWLLLTGAMVLLAALWGAWKQRQEGWRVRTLKWLLGGYFLYVFLAR
jgi:uncharacterized membrane protein